MNSYRILIIENNSSDATRLKKILEEIGYSVINIINSSDRIIDVLKDNEPELIIKNFINESINEDKILDNIRIPKIYIADPSNESILIQKKFVDSIFFLFTPLDEFKLIQTIEMVINKFNADNKIRESEARYNALFNYSLDLVYIHDFEGNFIDANNAALKLFGYSKDEIKNLNIKNFLDQNQFSIAKKLINEIKENNSQRGVQEYKIQNRFGDELYIETNGSLIFKNGQPFAIQGIARDITKHKQDQIALKNSEQKYKDIFEFAPIGIYRSNKSGEFLAANLALANLLGYSSAEEILELNLAKDIYFDPSEREMLINEYEPLGKAADIELKWKKKNGEPIWIQLNAHTIKDPAGNTLYFEGFVSDIDKRKKAEEEIFKLSRAIQQSPVAVVIMSKDGNIEYSNSKFVKASGFTPEQIIEKRANVLDAKELSSEEKKIIWETISSGKEWNGEFQYKRKDGKIFWESANISPIIVEENKIEHYLIILQDITDKKNQETQLIKAKEEAEKSDRLKTEFLAQMSHEIRTPLNNILTYTSLLKEEFEEKLPPGMESTFNVIDTSSQRLIRSIELILNLSRIQTGNFETDFKEFDIHNDLLEDLIFEFHSRAKMKNLSLKYQKQALNTFIYGDHYSLGQMFLNLIDNAIKYTHEGEIKVEVFNDRPNSLCVKISDTGIGISSEYLPFLFNPFSQEETGINRHFEGTGLGLALVKKYAEINNVDIKVNSEKWKGSEFILTIPGAVK